VNENRLFDNAHEPCGLENIKPSLKTFQKELFGDLSRSPANPPSSLVVIQKELQHGLLLVEEIELGLGLAYVTQIAFGEVKPIRATGLVGHHDLRIFDRLLGSPKHGLCDLAESALRVWDHPLEASKFVFDTIPECHLTR